MAKKISELNEVAVAILDMLKSKPERKSRSAYYPNEKNGLYNQAGIIFHLEKKYTGLKVSQALNDLNICKEVELKHIKVKNFYYEENTPYYYLGESLSEEEANKITNEYEAWSKEQAKEIIQRRIEERKKNVVVTKKRKVSQKQIDALARARAAKKK